MQMDFDETVKLKQKFYAATRKIIDQEKERRVLNDLMPLLAQADFIKQFDLTDQEKIAIYTDSKLLAQLEAKVAREKAANNRDYANIHTVAEWIAQRTQDYIDRYFVFDDEGTAIWSPHIAGKSRERIEREKAEIETLAVMNFLKEYWGWPQGDLFEQTKAYFSIDGAKSVDELNKRLPAEQELGLRVSVRSFEYHLDLLVTPWRYLGLWFDDEMHAHLAATEGHLANGEPYP